MATENLVYTLSLEVYNVAVNNSFRQPLEFAGSCTQLELRPRKKGTARCRNSPKDLWCLTTTCSRSRRQDRFAIEN